MSKGQHHNAKVYHVTSKKADTAYRILQHTLPEHVGDPAILFEIGAVWLNNQRFQDKDQKLPAGTTFRVYVSSQRYENALLLPEQIIAETKDWIIVDKPAGLSSVPDRSHLFCNMTSAVTGYFRSNRLRYSANAITRLDLMTSGLMLYAKNPNAERYFGKAMLAHHIHKQYSTILEPKRPDTDMPNCRRIRDKLSFIDKARVAPDGRDCHSLFVKHSQIETKTRYNVILFTGRRHQIRCHARHYLAPVLGDTFYGGKAHHSTGIALWAAAYNFRDLSGKKIRVRLPNLDQRIQDFLAEKSIQTPASQPQYGEP
jgi:23S rRNA pseudouridine1911/1915/1917 synthase